MCTHGCKPRTIGWLLVAVVPRHCRLLEVHQQNRLLSERRLVKENNRAQAHTRQLKIWHK
jgi:hypothetical protein